MSKVVQVELTTPNREPEHTNHWVTWVEATLKLAVGMPVVCKGDKRQWHVAKAYGMVVDMDGINSSWKVGGL